MYKKMNRVIEKEKGGSLLLQGIRLFLATDNRTLCKPHMNMVYIKKCTIYSNFFVIEYNKSIF
ncbi:hypothetical protein CN428_27770 [Bacillus cereus]|nr:hypothetical protein CN428_27770 [Bacillus cereus]PFQ64905.1 hypothetical protein COK21_21310 [Bacillus cereus]